MSRGSRNVREGRDAVKEREMRRSCHWLRAKIMHAGSEIDARVWRLRINLMLSRCPEKRKEDVEKKLKRRKDVSCLPLHV